jgi:MinD-like ATPase involved in chromosome partitioning or flagellar assembly
MSSPANPQGTQVPADYPTSGAASLDAFARPPVDSFVKRIVRYVSDHRILVLCVIVILPIIWVVIIQNWVMYVLGIASALVLLFIAVVLLRKVLTKPSAPVDHREKTSRFAAMSRKRAKAGFFSSRLRLASVAYSQRLIDARRMRASYTEPPTGMSPRALSYGLVRWTQTAYSLVTGKAPSAMYLPYASQSIRRSEARTMVCDSMITEPKVVSVLLDKGGIGKTTIAFSLSNELKGQRPDLAVVLNDIDNGTLGVRIRRTNRLSLVDFLANLEFIKKPTDLARYCTVTTNGLMVLPYARSELSCNLVKMTHAQTHEVIKAQKQVADIVVNDLSPNLDERNQGALDITDRLVIVTTPAKDSIEKALHTVRFLIDNGYAELAKTATIIVMRAMPWTRLEDIYQLFVEKFGEDVSGMSIGRFNFSMRLAAARDLDKPVVGPRTVTVLRELVAKLLGELADAKVSDEASQRTHLEAAGIPHSPTIQSEAPGYARMTFPPEGDPS